MTQPRHLPAHEAAPRSLGGPPTPATAPGTSPATRAAAASGYDAGLALHAPGPDGAGAGYASQSAAAAPPAPDGCGPLTPIEVLTLSNDLSTALRTFGDGWTDRVSVVRNLKVEGLIDSLRAEPDVIADLVQAALVAVTTSLLTAGTLAALPATAAAAAVAAATKKGGPAPRHAKLVEGAVRAVINTGSRAASTSLLSALTTSPKLDVNAFLEQHALALEAERRHVLQGLEDASLPALLGQGPDSLQAARALVLQARAMQAHAATTQATATVAAWAQAIERAGLKHRPRTTPRGEFRGPKAGVLEVVLDNGSLTEPTLRVAEVRPHGIGDAMWQTLLARTGDQPLGALLDGAHSLTLHITDTLGLLDITTSAGARSAPRFPSSGRAALGLAQRARVVYETPGEPARLAAAARVIAEVTEIPLAHAVHGPPTDDDADKNTADQDASR